MFIASELGSMVLGNQIDTLRVFGVDPVKKLVTPRIAIGKITDLCEYAMMTDMNSLEPTYLAVYQSDSSNLRIQHPLYNIYPDIPPTETFSNLRTDRSLI